MNHFQQHSQVVPPHGSLADFLFGLGKEANRAIQRELGEANAEIDHRPTIEDVDDYAESYQRILEKAQRLYPSKPFNPPAGDQF
jgi:hypothetical protein